jgi:hypothetical protein
VDVRKLRKDVWPYQTTIRTGNTAPADRWCSETIGFRSREYYSYDLTPDKRTFAFKDRETLLVFKLKYGTYETN